MKSEELYKKANNLYKNEKYFEALSLYQKIKERNISLFIDKDINRCKKRINEIQNIKQKYLFYGSISENKLKIINELKNSFSRTSIQWISDTDFLEQREFLVNLAIELNINLKFVSDLKSVEIKYTTLQKKKKVTY